MNKLNKNDELRKLKKTLLEKVKSENDDRYKNLSSDEMIKTVIDASNKGKYVFWVLREYFKENIQRFEDMGRVKQALTLFKNNLSKFTEQEKQLNKLSFQELETLVSPYQDILTQNDIKRMNKEKIWLEIDVIYEGPEGRVYIPKTKEAAIFLGQGTRWCTAATKNNMFEYYNKQGPLYVFVTNKKDEKGRELKYQIHLESNQFMDSKDQRVEIFHESLVELVNKFSICKKIIMALDTLFPFKKINLDEEIKKDIIFHKIKKDHHFFKYIVKPDEQKCLEFIKINPDVISMIENPTDEMKMDAIKIKGNSIRHIFNPTNEMKLEAVKQNGLSILYIKDQNEEIKWEAIRQTKTAISYVKSPSEEMKIFASKRDDHVLGFADNSNYEFTLNACKKNGELLAYVRNPSHEVIMAAIAQNGNAIRHVEKPTTDMKLLACKTNGMSLKFISSPTEEIKMEAIKQNGLSIYIINEPTHEMKLEAVKQNATAIDLIDNPSEEIMMAAFHSFINNFDSNQLLLMLTRLKLQKIENIQYIIENSKNNPLVNTYFKSYLEDILKKTPKNDEEITMKI